MAAVEWERISPAKTESVISMLLKNLYPDAERIWGAGGDGGRDVQIRHSDGGLDAFEIKGFTGRLNAGRKAQIKRSLLRSAQLNPISWTLLMPLDPTPTEEAWLRSLRKLVGFPTTWHGRLFLDTELAKRPWIERYHLGDVGREVVRLLEQVGSEQAALGNGMPDAIARIERVTSDLNELDAFYVWRVSTDGQGNTTVMPSPRYRGAEIEHPLTIQVSFQFGADPDGRRAAHELQQHVDFGTPVDVPAEYVERVRVDSPVFPSGEFPAGGRISVRPHGGSEVDLLLAVGGPEGETMAAVPISGSVASSGQRGSIVELRDASGCLAVQLRIDFVAGTATVNLKYEAHGPFYPAQLRPVVALLSEMRPPNTLEVRSADGDTMSHSQIDPSFAAEGHDRFLNLLDDLALIQWAAGRFETIGPEFSRDDFIAIREATQLLGGEALVGSWSDASFTLTDDASAETRRLFAKDAFQFAVSSTDPYTAHIAGREYRLGRGVRWEVESATMAPEHDEWRTDGPPPGARVRLVPKTSDVVRRWLLNEGLKQTGALQVGPRS